MRPQRAIGIISLALAVTLSSGVSWLGASTAAVSAQEQPVMGEEPLAPGETASPIGCPETLAEEPTGSPALAMGDLGAAAGPGTAGAPGEEHAMMVDMHECHPMTQ
jgi:hypothetical protein